MKKIKIDFRKLQRSSKGSSWQKALLLALVVVTGITIVAYGYLLFRPVKNDLKKIIDDEVSAVDINFDEKVIDNIKARQEPAEYKSPDTGKNPFASF